MKPFSICRTFSLVIVCLILSGGCSERHIVQRSPASLDDQDRIAAIRKSTVRILVDGKPKGSGFIVAEHGLIATAFHVVAKTTTNPHGEPHITYASSIEVQFEDGEKLPALPHTSCLGMGIFRAMLCDFAILEVSTEKKRRPLLLGSFKDVREGSRVYLAGFPLMSERPRATLGRVAMKWEDALSASSERSSSGKSKPHGIAILDIEMSRGDSGGPIVLIGETPAQDRVIGIASFIMHPLDQELKTLLAAIRRHTEGREGLICSLEFLSLLRKEYGNRSLFLAGCLSIEPVKSRLRKEKDERRDVAERVISIHKP